MKKLAIYVPGIGYHCDKPLLYYSRDIGYELGYEEYINVNYSYKAENIRGNLEKMTKAFESLYSQTEDVLKEVAWENYDEILFVSKSIGTIIAAAYAKKHGIKNIKHVLYTPLIQTYDFDPENAIAFIGSKDAWSDAERIQSLSKEHNIPINVYEDCNHSLECEDTIKNIKILMDVMNKTKEFIIK